MPNQVSTTKQITFAGAIDAVTARHALQDNEVAAATNIDFSLEWGAASVRRGSIQFGSLSGIGGGHLATISLIRRNYGLSTGAWNDPSIPWYAVVDAGTTSYKGYTFSGSGTPSLTLNRISGYGASLGDYLPVATQYEGYIYIGDGSNAFRTNGAATYDWIIPQADTPIVTYVSQLFGGNVPYVGFAGTAGTATYTATEGTITGTSTTTVFGASVPVILATCSSGTGTRIVVTGSTSSGLVNWDDPVVFVTLPTGTGVSGTYTLGGGIDFHQGWPGGDTTGGLGPYTASGTVTNTVVIGNYGTDFVLLALTNQSNVVTIQRDLSIGDATFTNYWHQETTPSAINDSTIDPVIAMIEAQGNQTIDVQTTALNVNRGLLPHVGVNNNVALPPIRRTIGKTTISASPSPWAVSRSDYQFIGVLSNPDFTNIKAVRVIIEFSATGQSAIIGGWATFGGYGYPLNDQTSGISYYQTFARVENGVIVAEGAASNPSPPTKCQYSNAELVCSSNSNTTAGITHRVFYRTGGLLQDAYRVGSCTITTSSPAIIYDYGFPDMLVISNPLMKRFLWSAWPDPSAGVGITGVNAVSPPWQNRIWVGVGNQLYWSVPGVPTQIQNDSQTTVADNGDNIFGIVPAQNLVIVNQASVYEMAGSIFEGTGQNWSLTRTMARRGAAAQNTVINTPYGVLLFSNDGISFYRQGWGIDQEQQWIYDKIGDLWRGTGATDPAGGKGRIPALNLTNIFYSCAAYKDEKIYLAVPTGSNTYPDTVFVLDMAHQKVWMYQYGYLITSLFWDQVTNRLVAGTNQGLILQLETGLSDLVGGSQSGVGWQFQTKEWSGATDQLVENIQLENQGTSTWLAVADSTNTYTLTTSTQTSKGWSPASLQGTVGDAFSFIIQGTQSASAQVVYAIEWDAIEEVKKVTYFETDPIAQPSETYVKTWLPDLNVFGGTTTGTVLIDGTVVMSATFTNPTSGDVVKRKVYEVGLPNVTYGKNVCAVYSSPIPFRYYDTKWEFEPKPFGKLTWLVTYKKAGGVTQADMGRFFAMDIEGLATNTITTTWIIDGTVFCTNTLIFGSTDAGEEAGVVRNYMDWIPFPPGGRGYLFQQQITAAQPFKVWRASLDIDRISIKGLSRITINGSPSEQG